MKVFTSVSDLASTRHRSFTRVSQVENAPYRRARPDRAGDMARLGLSYAKATRRLTRISRSSQYFLTKRYDAMSMDRLAQVL